MVLVSCVGVAIEVILLCFLFSPFLYLCFRLLGFCNVVCAIYGFFHFILDKQVQTLNSQCRLENTFFQFQIWHQYAVVLHKESLWNFKILWYFMRKRKGYCWSNV
jgi:hypothetical protein